jgi:hypothetical protein
MAIQGEGAIKAIYLFYKNDYKLSCRRTGNKIWIMYDNQYKGKTVAAILPLEKQDVPRTTKDL